MLVLGIDPGTRVTAWGVVRRQRGRLHYIDSGHVKTDPSTPMAERLRTIHAAVRAAIEAAEPDAVSVESIFRHRSSESALKLGHARGVVLLAAAECGFSPHEYNPSTVKRCVGASGRADKNAVARMVTMLLGVQIKGPKDLTDALAIAITHCNHARSAALGAR